MGLSVTFSGDADGPFVENDGLGSPLSILIPVQRNLWNLIALGD